MGTRDELRGRQDVPEEDLDDIVELAGKLQAESAGRQARRMTAADARAVASELAIDPHFVDEAIARIAHQKQERAAREREAARQRRRWTYRTALALAGAGVLATIAGGVGAGQVRVAAAPAERVRASLEVVIDRQAALLPQLVALAGGDPGSLAGHEARLRDAGSVRERLAASRELGMAMAGRLGKLAPAADPASAQQRLSLQHELIGSQNRITVEQRRYEEALGAWRSAASTPLGRLAVWLGWAKAPAN